MTEVNSGGRKPRHADGRAGVARIQRLFGLAETIEPGAVNGYRAIVAIYFDVRERFDSLLRVDWQSAPEEMVWNRARPPAMEAIIA